MVDGATALHLIGDELVAVVEEKHAELLDLLAGESSGEVIHQPLPVVEHRPRGGLGAGKPQRRALDQPDRRHRMLAQARRGEEFMGGRGEHGGETAETVDHRLGERLGIAARLREKEQHFEELVIGKRLGPAGEQFLAQPATMPMRADAGERKRRLALFGGGPFRKTRHRLPWRFGLFSVRLRPGGGDEFGGMARRFGETGKRGDIDRGKRGGGIIWR